MITKENYALLVDSLQTQTREDKTEFVCRKDDISKEIDAILDKVMFENDLHDLDLQYKIMQSALYYLDGVEYDDMLVFDPYEGNGEYASVYTGERLSYLNNWNDSDIADIVKEHELSEVSTACAVWYDRQVENILSALMTVIRD